VVPLQGAVLVDEQVVVVVMRGGAEVWLVAVVDVVARPCVVAVVASSSVPLNIQKVNLLKTSHTFPSSASNYFKFYELFQI
jgi:hypothetical protein